MPLYGAWVGEGGRDCLLATTCAPMRPHQDGVSPGRASRPGAQSAPPDRFRLSGAHYTYWVIAVCRQSPSTFLQLPFLLPKNGQGANASVHTPSAPPGSPIEEGREPRDKQRQSGESGGSHTSLAAPAAAADEERDQQERAHADGHPEPPLHRHARDGCANVTIKSMR